MRSEPATDTPAEVVSAFIARWDRSGAAERANYQLFLSELCDLIGVSRPEPAGADDSHNAYVFERSVVFQHGDGTTSAGRIDLYKRQCFVLEAKQGSNEPAEAEPLSEVARDLKRKLRAGTARRGTAAWDDAMLRARGQAELYARALPVDEGRPPFLVVVDVGHSIELYSEFSCTGGAYIPFPAPGSHRIFLRDLERADLRERLRGVWTAPLELDPSRRSARVTRDIAGRLARLAVSLEKAGHDPHRAAAFLMRCLFTMFAEDVGLLPRRSFSNLLLSLRESPEHFVPMVEELWQRMDRGGYSVSLRANILQFNGGLFEEATVLPLDRDQLELLLEAAQSDWRDVEPAIFGTLLERALDPVERHKLGAHYTPRAYVERLVMPTIVEPVRAEWQTVHAAAVSLATAGDLKKAAAEVKTFHRRLCHVRVLDPACGSGNFLYVTLEHLKRIEGEALDLLNSFGERQAVLDMAGETVGPHQLLGLEINPRAAAIAELVLWIGTLQWHFRNRGNVNPPQPIIRNFRNIQCRDALIEYDKVEPVLDAAGQPVTRWDGRTTKTHPVTGREVPDDSARTPVVRYVNPRPAQWPEAEYVVGNPPFIGNKRMRFALGDGYVEAVRTVWRDVPEVADFVMYWWHHAARLAREGRLRRFGFVTTNSLRQTFNRRVVEAHLSPSSTVPLEGRAPSRPLSLLFAIPDHPWVDAADGAAVRIAMTVASAGSHDGALHEVVAEKEGDSGSIDATFAVRRGRVQSSLSIGAAVSTVARLRANEGICFQGFILGSEGFVLKPGEADALLKNVAHLEYVRRWKNGKDLLQKDTGRYVIDVCAFVEDGLRTALPELYQHLYDNVRPHRMTVRRAHYREKWWVWGESRPGLRQATKALARVVVTNFAAKHRVFQFQEPATAIDHNAYVIASSDSFILGCLQSRVHLVWMLSAGSTLEDRPLWINSTCFLPFAFPAATDAQKARIRELGEQLDAHRKRQQAAHPELTMTGMYNVLEKLRRNEPLTAKDKVIHEQGLVSVLRQLHDDLDVAVADAYGWPVTLTDAEILERLVTLNAARAAEEAAGQVRWLRPEYQAGRLESSGGGVEKQAQLEIEGNDVGSRTPEPRTLNPSIRLPWPSSLPDQIRAVRVALTARSAPATPAEVAKGFMRARAAKVEELLKTLATLGQAREVEGGRYVGG